MFKSIFFATAAIICSLSTLNSEMPEPYRSINLLPFDGHGWFASSNAIGLKNFIEEKNPKIAIEVGSWLGSSARFIASNLQEDGILYAVDTWLGSVEHTNNFRVPTLYQQFLSNVIHKNLTHKIIPVRMTSLEAAEALAVNADLIYVDAAHDTDSVRQDVLAWYKHLNEGGVICGDDWGWASVQIGLIQAAVELNIGLYAFENFWWLE